MKGFGHLPIIPKESGTDQILSVEITVYLIVGLGMPGDPQGEGGTCS